MWADLRSYEKQVLSPDPPDNAIDSIERGKGTRPRPGWRRARQEAGTVGLNRPAVSCLRPLPAWIIPPG